MPRNSEKVSATNFKATCLKLLDEVAARKRKRVLITKHGRTVAMLVPTDDKPSISRLYGCMRGTVIAAPGDDFTEPALDVVPDAEKGILHR